MFYLMSPINVGTGGEVQQTIWALGEPNHVKGDCAYLQTSPYNRLRTLNCSKAIWYICEINL